MPGIAGIISRRLAFPEGESLIRQMVDELVHDPGSHQETFVADGEGVYLGGVSLPDAFDDCLPVMNEDRSIILFFTGECFFNTGTEGGLRARKHSFAPETAEVLVHLYEEHGERMFSTLNGWFSGVLLDLKSSTAILFNDRYGIRRLFYHESETEFYFASEIKALLRVLPHLRKFDTCSIGQYLLYDCVLEDRTLFQEIYSLPAHSLWTFRNGTGTLSSYLEAEELENQSPLEAEHFVRELQELFTEATPKYFSSGKTGMSLTGGVDTRTILAVLSGKLSEGELPCYTFGGMYNTSMDVKLAREVASAIGQPHTTITLGQDFLDNFEHHAVKSMFITDGLTDITKTHALLMNELSRMIAPVRLTGKFGSQLLRNVTCLKERPPQWECIHQSFMQYIDAGREVFREYRKMSPLSFMLFKEIPWYWATFTTPEVAKLSIRSPFLDNEFTSLLYRAPADTLNQLNQVFQLELIRKHNPDLYAIPTNRGFCAVRSMKNRMRGISYKYLTYLDKAYNADTLPASLHHWVGRFDRLLAPLHPEKYLAGYNQYRHYRHWFQNELAGYVMGILLSERSLERPYWNRRALERSVREHCSGIRSHSNLIRKALTLELMSRVFIEAEKTAATYAAPELQIG